MNNKEIMDYNNKILAQRSIVGKTARVIGVLAIITYVIVLIAVGLALLDVFLFNLVLETSLQTKTVIVSLIVLIVATFVLAIDQMIISKINSLTGYKKDKKKKWSEKHTISQKAVDAFSEAVEGINEGLIKQESKPEDDVRVYHDGPRSYKIYENGDVFSNQSNKLIGWYTKSGRKVFQLKNGKTIYVDNLINELFN